MPLHTKADSLAVSCVVCEASIGEACIPPFAPNDSLDTPYHFGRSIEAVYDIFRLSQKQPETDGQ
jgi:hypothetical protein